MPSIILVKKEALPKLPIAVQKYIEDWFVEATVFGIQCLVVQGWTSHPTSNSYGFKKKSGIAPTHSVDLMYYERQYPEGLEGMGVGRYLSSLCGQGDVEIMSVQENTKNIVYTD
jgi:hypothetical protein